MQEYDPLTGDPLPKSNQVVTQVSTSESICPDLSRLDSMTPDELKSLITRLCGAMWCVGLKTQEEIAEAFKLKLAISGMAEKDMFKALPIMREWFDRSLGKASQSIAMTVEDKGLSKLSDERLLRLERELARVTGQDAVIIPPMPSKLTDQ